MTKKQASKKADGVSRQVERIVSPRKVRQEFYDDRSQIIYVELFNEFAGKWITRFELYKYPLNSNGHDIVSILLFNGIESHIIYKIINMLAVRIDVSSNFRELRRKAG